MSIIQKFKINLLFLIPTILYSAGNGFISGTVFQDLPVNNQILNRYGVQDSNELGVKGITVTAYPDGNSTITDENGSWILNVSQNSRVEFSNFPSYLKESSNGNLNNSSIQFLTSNDTNITFGLHNPNDYSHTINPLYVNNIQQNGNQGRDTLLSLHSIHYRSNGLNMDYENNNSVQGEGESPSINTNNNIYNDDIGSVWGKAYQKNKKRLFITSMLQRHIGLINNDPSKIYIVDYSSGKQDQLLGSFSLQGKIPQNNNTTTIDLGIVDRGSNTNYLLSDKLSPNIDIDAYSKVGKISYGGIDIDHNSNTLWLINLKEKGLISIDASGDFNSFSTATINQYLIETLPNTPTCINGELRPWALKVHNDKGYIGLICDGSTENPNNVYRSRNDLHAYIISFKLNNPQLGFTNVLDFPLNYARQLRRWYAWEDNYVDPNRAYNYEIYSQPILSDIEFDEKNNIYLAFMDRYATQIRTGSFKAILNTTELEKAHVYGDILKACNNRGRYELEGTGTCSQTLRAHNISLGIPEFFNDIGGGRNRESSLGSLALLKGSHQILSTTVDPHPETTSGENNQSYWFTQGIHTLSTENGSIENWYSHAYSLGNGLNVKANGIGDIELITNPAPIEVGNRIWNDDNNNGIQDANETGISGIEVNLICNGILEGNVTTNTEGTYIFSNDPKIQNGETYNQFNITALMENNTNNCLIRIPNISGNNQQSQLTSKFLTNVNIGEGNNSTLNDSNAQINGNHAIVSIQADDISISGINNHSFDIGFTNTPVVIPPIVIPPIAPNRYTLGNRVWLDTNQDGIQDSNETGVNGITVNLYNNSTCARNSIASTTTSNGRYQFANLLAGTYCVAFSNLPNNHNISSANQGNNNTSDSDANSNAQITNINLNNNDNSQDMGIYSNTSVIVMPNPYTLGDRVWLDTNQDGIQDPNELGVNGITVKLYNNATCTGNEIKSTTTTNGFYQFTNLLAGTYCIDFSNLPNNHNISSANQGSDNTSDSDANTNAQISNINLNNNDNSQDMGIYPTSIVLGSTICQEMTVNDDVQHANAINAITTIEVLNNDMGSKSGQEIKFLSQSEGRSLWENSAQDINSVPTLDTLVVAGEGTWTVVNGKVIFTALTSFDGQIPSPVYYIIKGADCTANTQFSNVAQIRIDTPCNCPTYSTKSIDTLNLLSIFLLILLTMSITLFNIRKEL